uniref:Secreted protein n=1 Tax=Macrostomum lignano TaxID=282301 RepID=A0A1I8JRS8_9PLAT
MIMQKLFVLLCCILLVQLHFALGVSSDKHRPATDEDYCCLPMKWHAKMMKASHRTFQRVVPVLGNWTKASSNPPTVLDVFVNYRRPRFELVASSLASSLVFLARPHTLRHLNRVPAGYHPSGGLAPLFFRCLARENGFERISPTHYRLDEREDSSGDGGSTYFKHIDDGRSIALFKEADVLPLPQTENGVPPSRRQGWPDRQFTEKARSFRDYYRLLLRSNRIQLNQPPPQLARARPSADLGPETERGNED